MTLTDEQQYEYKPPWMALMLGVVCGGVGAAVSAFAARSNRGLLIEGIIPLSRQEAAVFWWIICTLSVGFALFAARLAVHRLIHKQRIVLGLSDIILPATKWSPDEISVPYTTITAVWETRNRNQRFLKIAHRDGVATIIATFLPTMTNFNDIRSFLEQRVEAYKGCH